MTFDFSAENFPQGSPIIDTNHVPGGEIASLPKFLTHDKQVVHAFQVAGGEAAVAEPTGARKALPSDWVVFQVDGTVKIFADIEFHDTFKKPAAPKKKPVKK